MTEETGAAAPSDGQAATSAPAESEQATSTQSNPEGTAAPENAETKATEEQPQTEGQEDESDKPAKLTRNQRLQRKAARLATMVAEQQAELESLRKKTGSEVASELPKAADYPQGEYDPAYLSDLAAHKAAAKIGGLLNERDQKSIAEKQMEARHEAAEDFLERAEELKTTIPDFDAVFEGFAVKGGKFAPHVIEELHESEKGPLLAYQLAKNPGLAKQLNGMSPRDAAREIGRLEAKASLPQPKKVTKAPPPLSNLTGGAAPAKDVHSLAKGDDLAAFIKLRNEEDAAKRR